MLYALIMNSVCPRAAVLLISNVVIFGMMGFSMASCPEALVASVVFMRVFHVRTAPYSLKPCTTNPKNPKRQTLQVLRRNLAYLNRLCDVDVDAQAGSWPAYTKAVSKLVEPKRIPEAISWLACCSRVRPQPRRPCLASSEHLLFEVSCVLFGPLLSCSTPCPSYRAPRSSALEPSERSC